MVNELITREDIVRGKKNFDALYEYINGSQDQMVRLPSGKSIKTLAGFEKEVDSRFPENGAGRFLTGSSSGRIPTSEQSFKAAFTHIDGYIKSDSNLNCSQFSIGTRYLVDVAVENSPPRVSSQSHYIIETVSSSPSNEILQRAYGTLDGSLYVRVLNNASNGVWSSWKHANASSSTYLTTTATSANVVVTATGELQRSTSSKIFKKDIEDISIPDYRAALKSVRPVSYRSTDATADRTDWSWYSFIAEELAAIDPRLVQMSSTEFFEDTDEDGNTFINSRELPEGEYAANGINTNGIVALMSYVNQQMLADIEALESEKTQLKTRMTKLEKRMDALENPAA